MGVSGVKPHNKAAKVTPKCVKLFHVFGNLFNFWNSN